MEYYEKMIAKLDSLGVSRRLVEAYVLPDWWTPELCEVEANRSLMEAYIFRALGIGLDDLRSADPLPETEEIALFRESIGEDWAAAFLAVRAAQIVARRAEFGAGDGAAGALNVASLHQMARACQRFGVVLAVSDEVRADWVRRRSDHGDVLVLGARRKSPAKSVIVAALRPGAGLSGSLPEAFEDFDRHAENRLIRSRLDSAVYPADFSESEERLLGILGM